MKNFMVSLQFEVPTEAQLCETYRYHSFQYQLSYISMSINRCVFATSGSYVGYINTHIYGHHCIVSYTSADPSDLLSISFSTSECSQHYPELRTHFN